MLWGLGGAPRRQAWPWVGPPVTTALTRSRPAVELCCGLGPGPRSVGFSRLFTLWASPATQLPQLEGLGLREDTPVLSRVDPSPRLTPKSKDVGQGQGN